MILRERLISFEIFLKHFYSLCFRLKILNSFGSPKVGGPKHVSTVPIGNNKAWVNGKRE